MGVVRLQVLIGASVFVLISCLWMPEVYAASSMIPSPRGYRYNSSAIRGSNGTMVVGEARWQKPRTLYIGGIFPMTGGWAGGKGCRPAVDLALKDINSRTDILPEYRLEMKANDSRVSRYIFLLIINSYFYVYFQYSVRTDHYIVI